ncbi:MAG: helix-turn-helix transcriptional regulator [Lachnospiraceae bacterium]|nr:helix-turn-helix transcriptional regulator [Lachnospiraceae bacterium]
MSKLSVEIGKKIKFYRKQRNLSAGELASHIYKGVSTVYKYENGSVAIDLDTLNEIAVFLKVPLSFFMDGLGYDMEQNSEENVLLEGEHVFEKGDVLFLYNYSFHKIVKSRIVLTSDWEGNCAAASLYYNLKSEEDLYECSRVYTGNMTSYDFLTYFSMVNHCSPTELIHICSYNPWKCTGKTWGIISGVLEHPLMPVSGKILISKEGVDVRSLEVEDLSFSKEEWKHFRGDNMLCLDNMMQGS